MPLFHHSGLWQGPSVPETGEQKRDSGPSFSGQWPACMPKRLVGCETWRSPRLVRPRLTKEGVGVKGTDGRRVLVKPHKLSTAPVSPRPRLPVPMSPALADCRESNAKAAERLAGGYPKIMDMGQAPGNCSLNALLRRPFLVLLQIAHVWKNGKLTPGSDSTHLHSQPVKAANVTTRSQGSCVLRQPDNTCTLPLSSFRTLAAFCRLAAGGRC